MKITEGGASQMIRITRRGFSGGGVYIGRPSVFGNPFPTKRSKYSTKVYTLRESLSLYKRHFESKILHSAEFRSLVEEYRKRGYLELDCWCINKTVTSIEDIDMDNCKCHGEIIAYYILKLL